MYYILFTNNPYFSQSALIKFFQVQKSQLKCNKMISVHFQNLEVVDMKFFPINNLKL